MTLAIRPARPEEKRPLEALQLRASLAGGSDAEMLRAHPEAVILPAGEIAASRVFVAERAGALLGFAAVRPHGTGEAELEGLFVEPAHWRRGIGRALTARAVAWALAQDARRLVVIANLAAVPFYEAAGFVAVGPYESRFGPALRMAKRLDG